MTTCSWDRITRHCWQPCHSRCGYQSDQCALQAWHRGWCYGCPVYTPPQSGHHTKRKLYTANKDQLEVLGVFTADMKTSRRQSTEVVYVVESLHLPLLSKSAMDNPKMVTYHLDTVQVRDMSDMEQHFLKLGRPLRDLLAPYDAVLDDNAWPYALGVPRSFPLPQLPKLKAKLLRMQSLGVIRPITETTDWCTGIVVIPKRNSTIRVCVEMTHLNKSIKHDRLQLPCTAEVLSQLSS